MNACSWRPKIKSTRSTKWCLKNCLSQIGCFVVLEKPFYFVLPPSKKIFQAHFDFTVCQWDSCHDISRVLSVYLKMIIYFPNIFLPCHAISLNLFWVMVFYRCCGRHHNLPRSENWISKTYWSCSTGADVPGFFELLVFIFFSKTLNNLHFVTLIAYSSRETCQTLLKNLTVIEDSKSWGKRVACDEFSNDFCTRSALKNDLFLGVDSIFLGSVIWYPHPDCSLVISESFTVLGLPISFKNIFFCWTSRHNLLAQNIMTRANKHLTESVTPKHAKYFLKASAEQNWVIFYSETPFFDNTLLLLLSLLMLKTAWKLLSKKKSK